VVRGRLQLNHGAVVRVSLADPAGPVDTVEVHGERPFFSLTTHPRAAGVFTYHVLLDGEPGESLSVAVRPARIPSLLVLDASPNFETAFLRRWLTRAAGQVTVRTTITRGRYRTEQVNTPPRGLTRLTRQLLRGYDLIVMDPATLAGLAAEELQAVHSALADDGVGLLLVGDHPGSLPPQLVRSGEDRRERAARISWNGSPQSTIRVETLPGDFPTGVEPLAWDQTGRTVVARHRVGQGWMGVSLVTRPSRWELEGAGDQFAGYWSLLLRGLARDTLSRVELAGGVRRFVDEPVGVAVLSTGSRPTVAIQQPDGLRDTLPLGRDPFDPRRWTSRYWPREAGLHTVVLPGREIPFEVRPARPSETMLAEPAEFSWPRLLAFLILTASLTVLWAEARRRGR
jgi:hypothetical protein